MQEPRSSRLEGDCPEKMGCLILRQIMTLGRGRLLTSLPSSVWSRPVLLGQPIALPTSISFFTSSTCVPAGPARASSCSVANLAVVPEFSL